MQASKDTAQPAYCFPCIIIFKLRSGISSQLCLGPLCQPLAPSIPPPHPPPSPITHNSLRPTCRNKNFHHLMAWWTGKQVRCVQAALVRKDEEMDQELSSLRQQHQRLKLQFQTRKPLQ